jgi:hypothetical protein
VHVPTGPNGGVASATKAAPNIVRPALPPTCPNGGGVVSGPIGSNPGQTPIRRTPNTDQLRRLRR